VPTACHRVTAKTPAVFHRSEARQWPLPDWSDSVVDDAIHKFTLTVLREEMHLDVPEDVDLETPLGSGGLGLDSLIILDLATRTEDEYDIDIVTSFDGVLPASFGEFVDRVDKARRA
jgi:acyl carrier protein